MNTAVREYADRIALAQWERVQVMQMKAARRREQQMLAALLQPVYGPHEQATDATDIILSADVDALCGEVI